MLEVNRICCLRCGNYYDLEGYPPLDGNCKKCHSIVMMLKAKSLHWFKVRHGHKPESWKKRGRKAYITRMANLYFKDRSRFERLMVNLREYRPSKVAPITRKINLIKREMEEKEC